jgi:hypothetical protein
LSMLSEKQIWNESIHNYLLKNLFFCVRIWQL